MTVIRCRRCPETFPNPLRLRAHSRAEHPEYTNRVSIPARSNTPPRTPRGCAFKRDTDTWPGRP